MFFRLPAVFCILYRVPDLNLNLYLPAFCPFGTSPIYPQESANTGHARKWRKWIKAGKIDRFIKAISELANTMLHKKDEILKALNYFIKNHDRMLYANFRKHGYFIGSGVVEAGCKTVVGKRTKQSGMFWHIQGALNVLSTRCAVLGNLFDDYWKQHNAA